MSAEGAVSPATGSNAEIRRRLEMEFRPSSKVAFQRREVRLRTEAAFRVFESNFEHVTKSLYHLTCTLPIKARSNPEVIDAVIGDVERRFAVVEKEVSDGLARMKTLAKNDGASDCDGYFNPEVLLVDILCPEVNRYVSLLTQVDEVIDTVNALTFATRLTSRERTQETLKWRNVAVRFSREIHNQHMRAEGLAVRLARGETVTDESLDATKPEPKGKSKGKGGRKAQPAAIAVALAEVKRERSNTRRQATIQQRQAQAAETAASSADAATPATPAATPGEIISSAAVAAA